MVDVPYSPSCSFHSKLNSVGTLRDLKVVEELQKLIFPEGGYYIKKTRSFRTPKVNSVFQYIASGELTSGENE